MICDAISFLERTGSGRAHPPRVVIETPNGETFEAYLKSPFFRETPFKNLLEREWIAGQLARQLSLPCAPVIKVRVTDDFIESIPDTRLRNQLRAGPEILIASISAGPGWNIWTSRTKIARAALPLLTQIYFFDTMIENWDRCAASPNLLVRGDSLLMIDHGEAFVTASGTDQERDLSPRPWALGGVVNCYGEYETHVLWDRMKPRAHVDLEAPSNTWLDLPDDTFALIAARIPNCWDANIANAIAGYLADARQNIDGIIANIQSHLQ